MRIEWTEPAEQDLGNIYDYIAKDSPYYAEQFVDRIIEQVFRLHDFPDIGRRVSEFKARNDNLRELIYQGYRIIYLIEST